MKRIVSHPEPAATGRRYWRSLDELQKSPEFDRWLSREFPEGASTLEGVDRRNFLRIMAAGFAFAGVGMAGCRRPEAKILAYGQPPEDVIPGIPTYYATSRPARGGAIPLVVETHGARPTKLEGNPSYARYGGTTDLQTQASILDLYDPDRAVAHTRNGAALSSAQLVDLLAAWSKDAAASKGAGYAFLAEPSNSPTVARLVGELRRRLPEALWAEYTAIDETAPEVAATAIAGVAAAPVYDFAAAKVIVALDSDFLGAGPDTLAHARGFADGRRIEKAEDAPRMNRLYSAESTYTITGAAADHRLRVATADMPAFAGALAVRVMDRLGVSSPIAEAARAVAGDFGAAGAWLDVVAADLVAHRGASLVVGGTHLPAGTQALLLAVNEALGNRGRTYRLVRTGRVAAATLADLAGKISAGGIRRLVILGGNPVYDAPADLDWAKVQARVPEVLRYGYHVDETSAAAGVHVAATHYLESWGDARTADGTVVPVQPMIQPLFSGMMEVEFLARLAGSEETDPYTLVFDTIGGLGVGADAKGAFERFLHDGVLPDSAYPVISTATDAGRVARVVAAGASGRKAPTATALEVRFVPDAKVDDGRFANNGWLQECPDPMTRLCWDNAVLVSPKLGAELGILPGNSMIQVASKTSANFERGKEQAPLADIEIGGLKLTGVPLHVQPGLADYTIVVSLGYGRTSSGRIGTGAGFNAYGVRTQQTLHVAGGARLSLSKGTRKVANVQEHWSYEGRDIFRETTAGYFAEHPEFVNEMGIESHTPPIYGRDSDLPLYRKAAETPRGMGIYETPDLDGTHQWGMSIDLTTCIGCQACVVACQAENNIPIVGKDQVLRGREMQWIRIDRYYTSGSGDPTEIPEDPQVALQPLACVHCENAPCESVCPVNATVHDSEGLNVMAYNRCIGTRYCANNCPYKVRRFNYFDYNQRPLDRLYQGPLAPKGMEDLVQMVKNPDVTVRMRGVMEKCTYCVQRIQQAKIAAKVAAKGSPDVRVKDGTIRTACQQACPTQAIVFGDIKDPESAVSKLKAREHDYAMLAYLNVRPRTTYLARIRNPNPAMAGVLKALGLPDVTQQPLGRQEYEAKHGHGAGHGDDHGHAHDHGAGEAHH